MIIIDIQFFRINGKLEAKEIGYLNVRNGISHTFLIKPNTHVKNLSISDQKNIFWLTKNFHGLNFMCGISDLNDVKRVLVDLIACENVYVNGITKKNWLLAEFDEKKLNFEVFDIAKQNSGGDGGVGVGGGAGKSTLNVSIKKLKRDLNNSYSSCIFHNNSPSRHYCALQNTFFIRHGLSNK